MIQVGELLGNSVGSLRTVNLDGFGLIGLDEVQVMIYLIVLTTGNLCGHEVSQHFLGPYIFKPFQGDEVAKPQMSSLVGNQFCARQFVLLGGILLKEDTAVSQLDSARMFHTSKLVVG